MANCVKTGVGRVPTAKRGTRHAQGQGRRPDLRDSPIRGSRRVAVEGCHDGGGHYNGPDWSDSRSSVSAGLPAASPVGVGLHRRPKGVACFSLLVGLVLADGRPDTSDRESL